MDALMTYVDIAPDDRLLALFFLAWRGFAAEADQVLAKAGLSRMHHRVLYTVVRTPELPVGELAAGLGISRQALHRPLADLRERGLVTSLVSTENGRERSLTITAKGRRVEQQASEAQLRLLTGIFEKLGPESKAGWVKVMVALAKPIAAQAPLLLTQDVARGLEALLAGAEHASVSKARRKKRAGHSR